MPTFRWGILGTGAIAAQFAEGLETVEDAELAAVGSRTRDSSEAFGERWGVPRRHVGYGALAEDPDVDAIYVSTPHVLHHSNTLLCLRAGKPVLCEKPFAINALEAEDMVRCAREQGVFLMEAMWNRWNPVTQRVRALVREGAIGELLTLHADFGFRAPFDAGSRLFDLTLGGGALLDVGVYCVSYAHMLFGTPPEVVAGAATLGETGVDEQSAWVFRYGGGELAVMSAAIRSNTPQQAILTGTEGRIVVPRFWCPDRLVVNKEEEAFELAGNGYGYEAAEAQRCIRAGLLETGDLPLDESVDVMRSLDRVREPWGLRYPAE